MLLLAASSTWIALSPSPAGSMVVTSTMCSSIPGPICSTQATAMISKTPPRNWNPSNSNSCFQRASGTFFAASTVMGLLVARIEGLYVLLCVQSVSGTLHFQALTKMCAGSKDCT